MPPISYSNTRLSMYKRCRLKYYWNYVDKQPQKEGPALRRGRAAHKALAVWYEGGTFEQSITAAWDDFAPHSPEMETKMQELDLILTRYLRWAKANDRWKVLEVETSIEAKWKRKRFMGIFDLVVDLRGKKFIVDHKFQRSHAFSHLEVDSQVSHYLSLARLNGMDVQGVIYNIVNLDLGNVEKVVFRETVGRQPHFMRAYMNSLMPQIKEMQKLNRKKLDVYPNWTKDCCWDCGFYRRCIDTPFNL